MKSNKCLFNKAIFKSDLRRFLPFAIPLLLVDLIIFPIIIYGAGFNLKDNPIDMETFVGFSVASDIFSFIFSGVFALLVFSYLYRPNRCNAIHAFPIGRRGLFITNFIAGYILLVTPQVIGFSIAIPGIYFASKVTGQILLMQFASIFVESFIFYSTGILAVMLAGNIFAGAVIYCLINFASTLLEGVVNVVLSRISYGLGTMGVFGAGAFSLGWFSFSPITEFIGYKVAEIFGSEDFLEAIPVEEAVVINNWSAYYPRLGILFGVAVAFIIISYIFYRIRKLECAGDMAAFKIEIPIISIIASFVGGSQLSLLINIFVPSKVIGFVIAFIIFSFISFIIAQMILRKSARVFNLKNIITWAVACVIAIVGLYSLSVYKTNYIPSVRKVKAVQINASYDMSITDKKDIELAEKFHKALIENEKNKKNKKDENEDEYEDFGFIETWFDGLFDESDYTVNICYRLENDNIVMREYGFDEEDTELVKMLNKFESKYHPESIFEDLEGINFEITKLTVEPWSWSEDHEDLSLEIPEENYDKVYAACKDYVEEYLKNYRTSAELDAEDFMDEFGDNFEFDDDGDIVVDPDEDDGGAECYEIFFSCRVSDKESQEKLEKLEQYKYDQSGASFVKDTYWDVDEWDSDGGEHKDHSTGTFEITLDDIYSDSEFFKIISSYAVVKTAV